MVTLGFPGDTVVKNLPVNAGDARDVGSILESGRSPGLEMDWKWQSTPVFFPGKPLDRGAWWATVHGGTKSQTG